MDSYLTIVTSQSSQKMFWRHVTAVNNVATVKTSLKQQSGAVKVKVLISVKRNGF